MIVAPIGFQFTPLREGRRKAAQEIQRGGAISIHAPPRGATRWQEPNRVRTPFQFTPLREGRPMCGIRVRWRRRISIHAPPRGATKSMPGQSTRRRFQFTPLREGRPASLPSAPWWTLFQFTPLREGRRWRLWLAAGWLCYFNSRPSARGDRSCRRRHAGQAPFQFTPLREGRPSTAGAVGSPPAISIHAPPRGATFSGCNAIITEH